MNKSPLVSVITPCLNGEKYVYRLLDSILAQTYSKIEFVFVNDGSTDKTEEIVLSYKDKFEEKDIKLKYVYQENQGLGGAINTGLQQVTGDFLCWPDSDDYLEPESIEKRLNVFEVYPDIGVVSSDAFIRSSNDLKKIVEFIGKSNPNRFNENQFELLLKGDSQFCPGTHMIKMDCFKKVNPSMKIYPCKRGQNWQLLLPMYYKFKRHYLDLPLYNYILYDNSMSQGDNTFDKKLARSNEHEDIIITTLRSMLMSQEEKEKYVNETKFRYARRNLIIAFEYRELNVFRKNFILLKQNNQLTLKDRLLHSIVYSKPIHYLFTCFKSTIRK